MNLLILSRMNSSISIHISKVKKNRLFFLISIILLISLLISISIAFAQQVLSQSSYKADNFFIELVDNRADLTQGTAIFKINNPTPTDIAIDLSKLTARTALTEGATPTESLQYYILKSIPYSETVTDYSYVCNPFEVNEINGTYINENCSYEISGWHWNNYTKDEYVPLEAETLKAGEAYTIKLVGTWQPKVGSNNREWFPKIKVGGSDYEQTKWAWWNYSFDACANISINNSQNPNALTNYQVQINLTAPMNSKAGVRFVNAGCNENAVLLDHWRNPALSSSTLSYEWVEVDTLPASGYRNISVYYNNTSAVEDTSNGPNTFIVYQDFQDGTVGSAPANWVYTSNGNCGHTTTVESSGTNKFMQQVWGSSCSVMGDIYYNGTTMNNANGYIFEGFSNYTTAGSQTTAMGSDEDSTYNNNYWWHKTAGLYKRVGAGQSQINSTTDPASSNTWSSFNWVRHTSIIEIYRNGVFTVNTTDTSLNNGYIIASGYADNSIVAYDNITVRKWTYPEPTYSIGSQEYFPLLAEEMGRAAIVEGIESIIPSAPIYTDQLVYIRNLTNYQKLSRFDKVTKSGAQIWAFNYLTGSDQPSAIPNITPSFYVLEMSNMSYLVIKNTVTNFISQTKAS